MDDALPLVLFGTVVSTKDKDGLGRVQVKIAGYGPDLTLPLLRVLQPMAGEKAGSFFLPEIGDEVVILRGAGNATDSMIILGCVYNGKRKPATPDTDDKNNIKQIQTRAGHLVSFSDKEGEESITIKTGDGKLSLIFTQKDGKVAILADKELTITSNDKLTVKSKTITVDGDSDIKVTGKAKIAVEGKTGIDLKSDANVTIQGMMVQITGKTGVEIG